MVDLGADAAHHAAVAAGQEQRRVAVIEERVEALAQVQTPLDPDRRSPLWRVSMKPVREVDELPNLPPRAHLSDLQRHGGRPYMPTSTDVFAKVREHDRSELLRMARELDALPSFRQLEGPSPPCPTSASSRADRCPWWRWRARRGSCSAPTTTSA